MTNNAMPLGFRIVGPCDRERRLVEYQPAFEAYCQCDDRAKIDDQGFLSPFQYGDDFRGRVVEPVSMRLDVRGFDGVTWSRFLWFDIDDADLERALSRCRLLVSLLLERYDLDDGDLLVFFSGGKGFHVGLPTGLWLPEPTNRFARCCRSMAETLAASAGIDVDPVVYQTVQPLRAPNSRHAKTGRYKRLVTLDELERFTAEAIKQRAAEPLPFEVPEPPSRHERAVEDWKAAELAVSQQAEATRHVDANRIGLNRSTLDFIRDGAEAGDRHRLLYSAAANLFDFGCSLTLASALLTESALDSGLSPNELRRCIENAHERIQR